MECAYPLDGHVDMRFRRGGEGELSSSWSPQALFSRNWREDRKKKRNNSPIFSENRGVEMRERGGGALEASVFSIFFIRHPHSVIIYMESFLTNGVYKRFPLFNIHDTT